MSANTNDSPGGAPPGRRPLTGIRVVDFGQFVAGPLAAALLADFGADVIRVERPDGGADRHVQPIGADAPGGAVYLQLNRNKRALALDPFDDRARDVVDRLIRHADVIVVNAPEATRDAMGLSWERVATLNPRLILATCTAFGGGPLGNAPGFDGIGQAMSGALHMTGKDGEPRKAYAHYVDHQTATLSAFGVMLALREREQTGRGQHVETSLLRSALLTMAANLIEEDVLQVGRAGIGNRAHLAGPADVFRTLDGHVLLQVVGDSMFRRCARLLQRPEWIDDPRFTSDEERGTHGAILSEAVAAWCANRSTEECIAILRAAGLPAAPVLAPRETLRHPDLQAGEFWSRVASGNGPAVLLAAPPVVLSASPGAIERGAPALGEHSLEILDELGLDPQTAQALREAGVVKTA
ncbi:MAG TPA: CoA transferase [Xanthobacteraceae bacterium]|nr:CoA transferase [Xanthobacteraceae bacterium]